MAEREGGRHSAHAVLTEDLTRTQIVQYAGASGDYNPLHTDDMFTPRSPAIRACSRTGCSRWAMTGASAHRLVRRRAAALLVRVRFVEAGVARRRSTATATVTSVDDGVAELTVETVNQAGEPVVTGTAKARVE